MICGDIYLKSFQQLSEMTPELLPPDSQWIETEPISLLDGITLSVCQDGSGAAAAAVDSDIILIHIIVIG
jgi:hypothetical protein